MYHAALESELALAHEAVSQLTTTGDKMEQRAQKVEEATKKAIEDLQHMCAFSENLC